jgi:hypothetical protein
VVDAAVAQPVGELGKLAAARFLHALLEGVEVSRRINVGGLFSDDGVVPLEAPDLSVLREVTRLDWGSVEAAILGTYFNARPTWLANAHAELDEAVFEAYGWPRDISVEDILKNLLALNLERSSDAGD